MIGKAELVWTLLLCFGVGTNAMAQSCDTEIPPSTPATQFADNGDGTVTDSKSGLMWAKCAEGLSGSGCTIGSADGYTWQEALDMAAGKSLAGYDDWRLPNINELHSIVEEQCGDPAINLAVFPNTPSSVFWSASLHSNYSNKAWYVNFNGGDSFNNYRNNNYYVRLVRSEQ